MKRPSARSAALALVVLAAFLTAAPAAFAQLLPHRPATGGAKPADPNKPTPATFKSPKLRRWINDVPDTGQFLPDTAVILRVGPRVTTVGDFVREYFNSYPEFRPAPDSVGRLKFLNTLINRDVLALAALAQGRTTGFEDRIALKETRQRALAQAVYQRFVRDSIVVTETETRKLWEAYGFQHRYRHILVEDRNAADRVRRELISGRLPWAVAVKKYSTARNDLGPDGELGWLPSESLEPGMAYAILPLKPGETSLPVQDREGWHIVQCIERRAVPAPDFTAFKPGVRNVIASARAAELGERLMAMLRLRKGVVFDTTVAELASREFKEVVKVDQQSTATSINVDAGTPEFSAQDTARLIARWNGGGRFSIGDLMHAFSDIPPVMRPNLNRTEAVIAFVQSIILEPAIAEFGAQQGLEQDPLVSKPLQRKLEELMVEHMYQDSIGSRIWVSKEERRAYYEKNKPAYFTYPSVEFAAIVRESKAGADSVERALRAGTRAAEILRSDSLGGRVSGSIQRRQQHEQGPYHKALFEEMRPGDIQVRGPDKKGDYAILQLISYDGGRQLSFEEVETLVDESLQNMKSEKALEAMIARFKQQFPVEAHVERLMWIALVDPSLD